MGHTPDATPCRDPASVDFTKIHSEVAVCMMTVCTVFPRRPGPGWPFVPLLFCLCVLIFGLLRHMCRLFTVDSQARKRFFFYTLDVVCHAKNCQADPNKYHCVPGICVYVSHGSCLNKLYIVGNSRSPPTALGILKLHGYCTDPPMSFRHVTEPRLRLKNNQKRQGLYIIPNKRSVRLPHQTGKKKRDAH